MIDRKFKYDVCIIGTGRVGLPLALSLSEVGLKVVGVDTDKKLRDCVNNGMMPFHEPGYEKLIKTEKLIIYESNKQVVSNSANIIITVGTPLHNHIETDLSYIQSVLDDLQLHIKKGQLIILRSTIAPHTSTYVKKWLEQHTKFVIGKDLLFAFCPERIAEGFAYSELKTLPQICGTEDIASLKAADKLFNKLTKEVLHTNYIDAELIKLFNNISRYINFAISNQFTLIANNFGANIYEIQKFANYNYPRCNIATPGLTAGTCLRKDFGMINEWNPYPDMLVSAWKINEYMPAMLVDGLNKKIDIYNKVVAILGFTFKKDTDDIRDSLAPKLYRYTSRKLPKELRVTDHNLSDVITDSVTSKPLKNYEINMALKGVDCVFVATNHTGYSDALKKLGSINPNIWIADIWNVCGVDKIYYQSGILAET